ncbi:MAG: aldehyde ferredoxin oxidoreductase family protein [Asgard group archaeon]|nr:aldehyde ferredoxin oxidoreductase family protein [Asgard group archaeon]
MEFNGSTGKILEIDLSTEKIIIKKPNYETYKQFLGGSGLAAALLYPYLSKALDPFDGKNPLGFFNGPLTGTRTPNCGRHVVCAKSPLTNIWGEANSGGKFGAYLKFCGYDGLIIKGKAKEPLLLHITNDDEKLISGSNLWGKNVFEVDDTLLQKYGKKISYATIGRGGENKVLFSSVMNEGDRAAGRTGLGAVMGSKKLKAIILQPTDRSVSVAKKEELSNLASKMRQDLREKSKTRNKYGTAIYTSGGMKYGDVPVKYWQKGKMENVEAIDGKTMEETILLKRYHCYGCVIGCGRIVKIDEGKYEIPTTGGPEYETLAGFGTNLLVDNLEGIAYANYMCNDYGLDTISTSQVIALVFQLYDTGIISQEELDGIEPIWGNIDAAIELVKKIGEREGLGNLLAKGSDEITKEYDISEEALTINGLELPYHDPRAFFSMATVYATSSRGACHNNGDGYKIALGTTIPEIDLKRKDRFDNSNAGIVAAKVQDFRSVYNGLIMCHFAIPPFKWTVKALEYATGEQRTIDDVILIGERITNLKRIINKNMGLTREDYKLPKRITEPLTEGNAKGKTPDLEEQLKGYFDYRKWDPTTAEPLSGTIKKLGLEEYS